jgi:epoxyqueuosine reductase
VVDVTGAGVQPVPNHENTAISVNRDSARHGIGFLRWLRNLAVALGNAPALPVIIDALHARENHPSSMVREHVQWALGRHAARPS